MGMIQNDFSDFYMYAHCSNISCVAKHFSNPQTLILNSYYDSDIPKYNQLLCKLQQTDWNTVICIWFSAQLTTVLVFKKHQYVTILRLGRTNGHNTFFILIIPALLYNICILKVEFDNIEWRCYSQQQVLQ